MTNTITNKVLKIQQSDGTITDYKIAFDEVSNPAIELTLNDGPLKCFEGSDLFKSLNLVRKYFEATNAKLLCNGARKDVYPSGMSRSMSKGRKVYALTIRQQATLDDLVDIFDFAEPDKVGTIKEQSEYYEKWINSLGS